MTDRCDTVAPTDLAQVNRELESALENEAHARRELDDVLAALDAGIMVVGAGGKIRHANRAVSVLTGIPEQNLLGQSADELVGEVNRMSDGEVVRSRDCGDVKTLLVARRDMAHEPEAEVVLLSDITARDREREARHRLEKLDEVFRTLAVLSHKINNPLTSLLGRAQMLRPMKQATPQGQKCVEVIEASANKIATLIRELAHVVSHSRVEPLAKLMVKHPEAEVTAAAVVDTDPADAN